MVLLRSLIIAFLAVAPIVSWANSAAPRDVRHECEALLLEMIEHEGDNAVLNPQGRGDNCVACVSAFVRNALLRKIADNAHTIEDRFGYTGREREIDLPMALEYLARATGASVSPKPVPFNNPDAKPGIYVIFAGSPNAYVHVVAGYISRDGRRAIYDPQLGTTLTWGALAARYGGGRAYQVHER